MRSARLLLVLLAATASCGNRARVEVTVRADPKLPADLLGHIQGLAVSVSGSETAQQSYALKPPWAEQRLVYHPRPGSTQLLIQVSALDGQRALVATGQAPVTLHDGIGQVTIVLEAPVAVTLTPAHANVPAGQTVQLTANVPVHFSVEEPGGGTIDASGMYRAPDHAGRFHIVATAQADLTQSATASVTVPALELLAGQLGGGAGRLDGAGLNARFQSPWAIANDGHGALYVGDQCALRRIDIATAQVDTVDADVCGAISAGSSGAVAPAGDRLRGIAADPASGDLYLLVGSYVLKRATLSGAISIVAGGNASPPADGMGVAAGFLDPQGIALGIDGKTLFVIDTCAVRRVALDSHQVSTIAGDPLQGCAERMDGTGTAARFSMLTGIAVHPKTGDLYVTDQNQIRSVALSTLAVTTVAGDPFGSATVDGMGTQAQFVWPAALTFSPFGTLYIVDVVDDRIRVLDLGFTNQVTTMAGIGGFGHGNGQLADPSAVAYDTKSHSLYIVETTNVDVRQLAFLDGSLYPFAGRASNYGQSDGVGAQAAFFVPLALAEDAPGVLYVADQRNATLRRVDEKTGQVDTVAGAPGRIGLTDGKGSAVALTSPTAVSADGAGNIYFADCRVECRIRALSAATGEVSTLSGALFGCATNASAANARFRLVTALVADRSRHLYIADSQCHTLSVLDFESNIVSLLAGAPKSAGYADGAGVAARFGDLSGMAYDGADTLFLADGQRVRAYSLSSKSVSTVLGPKAAASASNTDPPLVGLAHDGRSTLYIATGNTVRALDTGTSRVTVFAGAPATYSQVGLGPLPAALHAPTAMAFTADGSLVVIDAAENSLLIVRGPL
jgi:DNA-binding beta-propeller fold protein YncE